MGGRGSGARGWQARPGSLAAVPLPQAPAALLASASRWDLSLGPGGGEQWGRRKTSSRSQKCGMGGGTPKVMEVPPGIPWVNPVVVALGQRGPLWGLHRPPAL